MANHAVAHFQNDKGVKEIEIGVKEFMCCGASSPHDHPHVYLDMGADSDVICPYCSTHFKHAANLDAEETRPEGCLFVEGAI